MNINWININIKLPSKRGLYLVTRNTQTDKVCISFFYEETYEFGCFGKVIAWKPLPKPYQA